MKIESFVLSDVGRVRRDNQDSSGCFPERNLFVVADGMGGHKGGKQASEMAVAVIDQALSTAGVGPDHFERTLESLLEAVRDANRRILERAANDSELHQMGTTLVALLLDAATSGAIVHVGDSRAYRLRDDQLELLTSDHTIVNDLLRNKEISEAEANRHPYRHVLTRALGAGAEVSPDVRRIEVRAGDFYLICSDGVSGMLSPSQIHDVLIARRGDPEGACRELIDAANQAGGRDNATVVAIRCSPD
jgi:PPM family protein phosphatase